MNEVNDMQIFKSDMLHQEHSLDFLLPPLPFT